MLYTVSPFYNMFFNFVNKEFNPWELNFKVRIKALHLAALDLYMTVVL